MRAVLHFRRSNLSWRTLSTHFNKTVSCNPSVTPESNEYNKEFGDQSNNIITFSKINVEFKNKDQDNEIFCDRFVQQLNIIEQIPKSYIGDNTSISTNALEGTVHSCLPSLRQELKDLFPGRNITSEDSVLSVLCLNHRTETSMSTWDATVAREREGLASLFVTSAKEICKSLSLSGFWADFMDPYSGTPFMGNHTNDTLFETDPRMRNFGLQITDLGCCKVLCHPIWRENVFTGIIFTDAPHDHPLLASLGHDSNNTI